MPRTSWTAPRVNKERAKLPPSERFKLFLEHLSQTANVSASAEFAGITRTAVYDKKADDPEFSAAWEVAYRRGYEALEEEAQRRAFVGVLKPLYFKGRRVMDKDPETGKRGPVSVREYSDTLVVFLLKGRRRDVFGDKSEVTLTDGSKRTKKDLTDEELDAIIQERLGR